MDPWAKGEYWDRLPHDWKVWTAKRNVDRTKEYLAKWETREKEVRREVLERSKGAAPKPWDCQYIRRVKQHKKAMQDNLKYWEGILAELVS